MKLFCKQKSRFALIGTHVRIIKFNISILGCLDACLTGTNTNSYHFRLFLRFSGRWSGFLSNSQVLSRLIAIFVQIRAYFVDFS